MTDDSLLSRLESEISYEKISVTFSLEGRDINGIKRFCLNTLTVGKRGGEGWSGKEAIIVKTLVAKRLVRETYRDAVSRGAITSDCFKEEAPGILRGLDQRLEKLTAPEKTDED